MTVDWGAFEAAWHDVGCRVLAELAAAHSDQRLYVAAFHIFYMDDVVIFPPALAANVAEAVHKNYRYSTRFAPPEWRWDVLDATSDAMRPWYDNLTKEYLTSAASGPGQDAAGNALEVAHDAAMANVCKAMTTTARQGCIHSSLSPEFIVLILEGQRGDKEAGLLSRNSVEAQILPTIPELADYLRELEQT